MSEPMADDDLADIERGAPFAAPGYDEDIFALVAEVRRLRDGIRSIARAWDRWWPNGPASLAAAHFRTLIGDNDE